MNIVARAENEGRQHMVSAAPSVRGVNLQRRSIASAAQRVVDDDDDDFASLMNQDKAAQGTNNDSPSASWRRREGASHDVSLDDSVSVSASSRSGHEYPPPRRHDDERQEDEASQAEMPRSEFRSLEEEKQFYLGKINSFNTRGIPSHRRVSIDTSIEELKNEYLRLKRQSNLVTSVKFQRRILMAAVTGAEFVNKKFNPLNLKLDGWSESMMDSIEEYDSIFEQLHDKYSGTAEVAPEWQLMMMVMGSGFMFHLSNTLFRSVLPNVTDIAKQNPELMQNIANAMSSAMGQKGVQGGGVAEMGANLAMQAMQSSPASAPSDPAPHQRSPFPVALEPPASTRALDDADASSEASGTSGLSGLSDLRNVQARGRKRRKASASENRAVEINL